MKRLARRRLRDSAYRHFGECFRTAECSGEIDGGGGSFNYLPFYNIEFLQ